jgi:hypothetical protein
MDGGGGTRLLTRRTLLAIVIRPLPNKWYTENTALVTRLTTTCLPACGDLNENFVATMFYSFCKTSVMPRGHFLRQANSDSDVTTTYQNSRNNNIS